MTNRMLFLNIAVKDLLRSKEFFSKLGFTFDPRFSNSDGACMILSGSAFVMLLTEPHFRGFAKNAICDTRAFTEGLVTVSCSSRADVDWIVETALAAGASPAKDPQDHGFMYGRSFLDLDGHHWEAFWMDLAAMPKPA